MNRTSIAALVICLSAGMVGLAQAQTSPSTAPNPSMGGTAPSLGTQPSSSTMPGATMPGATMPGTTTRSAMRGAQSAPTRADIEQAQQQLKAQGLYRGAIDGAFGRKTKMAISRFQRRNGLPETAMLDQQTRERLMSGTTSGAGSTMAPSSTMGSQPSTSAPGSSSTAPQAPTKHY